MMDHIPTTITMFQALGGSDTALLATLAGFKTAHAQTKN